jgi:DNA replication protein DnaD
MTSQGWIKLHRKIQESSMYRNLNSKQRDVMLQLLIMANHKQNEWEWNGEIHSVQPGQIITSIQNIKSLCASDVSVQSVRTALLKLEKWQFLTNQSTKDGRIITICNYCTYQNSENEANNQTNKELTKHQQSSNKELTTNKNDKNINNEKNEKKLINEGWKERSDDITQLWIECFARFPTLIEQKETKSLIKKYGIDLVKKEFHESVINGGKSLRYIINSITNKGKKTNASNNFGFKSVSQQRLEYRPDPKKYKENLAYYETRFG